MFSLQQCRIGTDEQNKICGRRLMVVWQESQRQPSLLHQRAGPGCRCQQTSISGKEKTNLVDLVVTLVLVGWPWRWLICILVRCGEWWTCTGWRWRWPSLIAMRETSRTWSQGSQSIGEGKFQNQKVEGDAQGKQGRKSIGEGKFQNQKIGKREVFRISQKIFPRRALALRSHSDPPEPNQPRYCDRDTHWELEFYAFCNFYNLCMI